MFAWRYRFALVILWLCCPLVTYAKRTESKPNVLFIISDDQGFSDFGFTGNPVVRTPTLDRLAAQSAVFENFVVAAACSPSRAAFFTGREHLSTGVWGVPMRDNLHVDETLMPAWFRAAGYATLYAGKRDMGSPPYTTPWERGWDNGYFVSGYQHKNPRLPNRGTLIQPKGWTCDIITDLILDFCGEHTDQPWMATAAYIIPHLPFVTDESFAEPFIESGLSYELAQCYGSIAQMDQSIGRLLAGIERLGQTENTIVVFVSDNGMSSKATAASGERVDWTNEDWNIRNRHRLRGSKALAWENGIRVPMLIRWPNKVAVGKRAMLGAAEDILPTLLELTGIDPLLVNHNKFSGVSLRPVLKELDVSFERPSLFRIAISGKGSPRELESNVPRRFEDHHLVLRGSRFKYHALPGGESVLFDLASDPKEQFECSEEHPNVASQMA